MAVKLNKTRIRDTALLIASCFALILFTHQMIGHDKEMLHESFEFAGYFLISIAAMGRVYSTAFLGGFKNGKIINYGPFSVCRNPLYLFSFIGVCGISLISNHIVVMAIMPLGFLAIYIPLIKREEVYLIDKFGKDYTNYMKKTPRLFPKFSLYHAPAEVPMTPRTLLNSLKDAVMWFLAFPLIEIIEWLQNAGYLKPLYYLT